MTSPMTALRRRYQPYWQLYVFLILPVAYLIIFQYVPMAGLQLAFKKFDMSRGIWRSPWIGLSNFKRFFSSYQFTRVLSNTFSLSLYGIAVGFPFPIIFALMLNSMTHPRYKRTIQTITYLPHFVSSVVLVGMIKQVFHARVGLYGALMQMLTGAMPPDLFANPNAFPHMYVWSGVWQNFGWNSIIYLAALTSVSMELHEAAEVDGASRFQRVLHIELPALLPTVSILLILRMGSILGVGFEKIYLMQNDLNLRLSEVISTYVYKTSLGATARPDFAYATTIGMFNSVVNFIILLVVNSISNRLSEASLF